MHKLFRCLELATVMFEAPAREGQMGITRSCGPHYCNSPRTDSWLGAAGPAAGRGGGVRRGGCSFCSFLALSLCARAVKHKITPTVSLDFGRGGSRCPVPTNSARAAFVNENAALKATAPVGLGRQPGGGTRRRCRARVYEASASRTRRRWRRALVYEAGAAAAAERLRFRPRVGLQR